MSLVPDFRVWQDPISVWLKEGEPGSAESFEPCDVNDLVCDPPLPFFVLFEAARSDNGLAPVTAGGGRHLRPLGSIIVAETIFGSMRNHPVAFEDAGSDLRQKLESVCLALVGDGAVLAEMGGIKSMADLVRFMITSGAFGPTGPN